MGGWKPQLNDPGQFLMLLSACFRTSIDNLT
jgi:hypothetical protein